MNKKEFESSLAKRNDRFKKKLRKKATFSEIKVKDIFKKIGLKYKFQKGFYKLTGKYKGYHCIVDFYIPSLHLAIEIDGGYHDNPVQKRKDKFKDKWINKKREVKILRVKNKEVDEIVEKINDFIYKPRNRKYCNFKYWEEKYQKYLKIKISEKKGWIKIV